MTTSPGEPDDLTLLGEKIRTARGIEVNKESQLKSNNISYVWRMVLELVIGMLLGFGIGFGLDKWLETTPLMIVIMSLFGFAAGIKTMMVTAREFERLDNKKQSKE